VLNVLDEFTHECLAIRVGRKLRAAEVIDVLSDLFILRGAPAHRHGKPAPVALRHKIVVAHLSLRRRS
jgi:hypothetical protein